MSHTNFNYDQQLAKAREAAIGLKGELEKRILGQTRAAFGCCCGKISQGEAKAVKVCPAGDEPEYEYQIVHPIAWTVNMQELADINKCYSLGLSDFVPLEQVQELFNKYFEGIDPEKITKEYFVRAKKR